MYSGADDAAPFAYRFQRLRNKRANGSINYGGVEFFGRSLIGRAGPLSPKTQRESLAFLIPSAGKDKNPPHAPAAGRHSTPARNVGRFSRVASPAIRRDRQPISPAHKRGARDGSGFPPVNAKA